MHRLPNAMRLSGKAPTIRTHTARLIRHCRCGLAGYDPAPMLVWTSLITRDKRRSLLSLSGTVLGALFFVHLATFYGWTLPWLLGGLVVAFFVIRSVGATVWFLSRHPFSVCDLGLSEAAAPGGAIHCAVRIVTRRPVEIKEVRVTLTAEQRDAEGKSRKVLSQITNSAVASHCRLRAGGRPRRNSRSRRTPGFPIGPLKAASAGWCGLVSKRATPPSPRRKSRYSSPPRPSSRWTKRPSQPCRAAVPTGGRRSKPFPRLISVGGDAISPACGGRCRPEVGVPSRPGA